MTHGAAGYLRRQLDTAWTLTEHHLDGLTPRIARGARRIRTCTFMPWGGGSSIERPDHDLTSWGQPAACGSPGSSVSVGPWSATTSSPPRRHPHPGSGALAGTGEGVRDPDRGLAARWRAATVAMTDADLTDADLTERTGHLCVKPARVWTASDGGQGLRFKTRAYR
jgi:hypothetical protein